MLTMAINCVNNTEGFGTACELPVLMLGLFVFPNGPKAFLNLRQKGFEQNDFSQILYIGLR